VVEETQKRYSDIEDVLYSLVELAVEVEDCLSQIGNCPGRHHFPP
jgi:hypothetical protein